MPEKRLRRYVGHPEVSLRTFTKNASTSFVLLCLQATTDVTTAIGAVPGMSEDSVTTLDVSVQPQYNYPRDGGEPTINGYLFSQRLQVMARRVPILLL